MIAPFTTQLVSSSHFFQLTKPLAPVGESVGDDVGDADGFYLER